LRTHAPRDVLGAAPRQERARRLSGRAARRPAARAPRRRAREDGRPRRDGTARRAGGVIAPADDLEVVRELLREYAESLGVELGFQDFDREIATLADYYELILVARVDDGVAGCIALRRIDHETCEMKRLYIRPPFRRHNLGRALAEAIIDAARRRGYASMRL